MAKAKKTIFESIEAEVINEAGNYIKDKVKRKIIRISEISALILFGMLLISIGIAEFIAGMYPQLPQGSTYLFLGIVFLITSYLLKV